MFMNLKDWKQAVRTPPAYRVGNSTLRIQTQFVAIITLVGFLTLIVIYRSTDREKVQKVVGYGIHDLDKVKIDYAKSGGRSNDLTVYDSNYNSTYPLTRPVKVHDALQFRIALVTDLDHSSSSKLESNTWVSYMMKGYLMWTPASYGVSITWDKPTMTTLKTTYGHSGRGILLY
jgi:soluble calcium-activated nucleotidase 1